MDEVHIRSDASYKGGKILGAIDNPSDLPSTVFSMMISSLMKRFRHCSSNSVRVFLHGWFISNYYKKQLVILKVVIYLLRQYVSEKTYIYPDFETCTDEITQPVITPSTQLEVYIPVANIILNPRKLTKSKYPSICFAAFDDLRTLYV